MANLWQDLRYGFRALRKSPGFALSAAGILALGIGANTAIFTVVNAVLLRPLPYDHAEQLVRVDHVPPARSFPGIKNFSVSPANYLDWREQNHVFENMSVYGGRAFTLLGGDRPEPVGGIVVPADFFAVLRMAPSAGRVFTAAEEQAGHDDVVVLSHAFAQSHFGSDTGALGRKLDLSGRGCTVIGVMPASFSMESWTPVSRPLWLPLAWSDKDRAERKNHNYQVVARLRPGVDVHKAQAEMDTISSNLAQRYPEADQDWGAVVDPLRNRIVGDAGTALVVLLGAVSFVLLIACANVANLVLARTLGRRKEMAIRAALGAGRVRAIRQVLTETLLLSVTGGVAGLFIGSLALDLLRTVLAKELPLSKGSGLDGRVLAFAVAISLLTGVIAGLAPSWRLTRADLNDALKQGLGRTDSDAASGRTRGWLVVAEVALAMMLLIGAGLTVRSLQTLGRVDPGMDTHNVLTMTVAIPQAKYKEASQQTAFFAGLLERVRTLPGVDSAGVIDSLPMNGGAVQPIAIPGQPAEIFSVQPTVDVRVISPGYLQALRIPLLGGRGFTDGDVKGRPDVVLISQAMARRFWADENPIGKHLIVSFSPDITREVVGVVGDVKERGIDAPQPVATLYEPFAQGPGTTMSLAVRARSNVASLETAVAGVVQQVDREVPLRNVHTLEEIVDESLFQRRFNMSLLAAFAGLALVLAAGGIYGVLSYTVRRRFREISVRMALGAQTGDVLRMVLIEGMRPALVGLGIGLCGALALGSVLSKLIFGVKPADPVTFLAVAAVLGLVALCASLVPAWRATRVDPIRALREE